MAYAQDTSVPVERSRAEIERLLRHHGATSIASGWEDGRAAIQCRIQGRVLRFTVPLPLRAEYGHTPAGRTRTTAQITAAVEQAERSRWRALMLVIKAKIEAVESGIETFENAFLGNILLPSGETMGEWATVELERVYATNTMPSSMLSLPSGS